MDYAWIKEKSIGEYENCTPLNNGYAQTLLPKRNQLSGLMVSFMEENT